MFKQATVDDNPAGVRWIKLMIKSAYTVGKTDTRFLLKFYISAG